MTLHEGVGADLIPVIREAARAVVFISVPWSGPERSARKAFRAAAMQLQETLPELAISFFRLDVDEDPVSQSWLSSVGFLQLAGLGAGSLLWLESGRVISSEITANTPGPKGIVARTISLWRPDEPPEPARGHDAADIHRSR